MKHPCLPLNTHENDLKTKVIDNVIIEYYGCST